MLLLIVSAVKNKKNSKREDKFKVKDKDKEKDKLKKEKKNKKKREEDTMVTIAQTHNQIIGASIEAWHLVTESFWKEHNLYYVCN
jgi:hypothetical protein